MVTIYDIAKRVGVAPSTVSRALADFEGVSLKTRAKIKGVAKTMGYAPNLSAKNLKIKKSYNIGVIMYMKDRIGFRHQLFADVFQSFAGIVEEKGYDITLFSSSLVLSKSSLLEHCRSRGLDGVFLIYGDMNEGTLQELINSEIPTVVFDHYSEDTLNINAVASDNAKLMFKLANYIMQKGHKNIVHLTGRDIFVANERVKGFKMALEANGIPFSEDMLVTSDYHDIPLNYKLVKEVLLRENRPTAIIMPDDYSAIALYNACKEMGLKIPQDISIAGFDGLEIGQLMTPPITTIKQDTLKIGSYVANKLLELIENKNSSEPIIHVVNGQLIEGQTIKTI